MLAESSGRAAADWHYRRFGRAERAVRRSPRSDITQPHRTDIVHGKNNRRRGESYDLAFLDSTQYVNSGFRCSERTLTTLPADVPYHSKCKLLVTQTGNGSLTVQYSLQEALIPHASQLLLHTISALSHIFGEIRVDAIGFLDVIMEYVSGDVFLDMKTQQKVLGAYLSLLGLRSKSGGTMQRHETENES